MRSRVEQYLIVATVMVTFLIAQPARSAPKLNLPEGVTLSLSNQHRLEIWNFFEPASPGGDESYTFGGNRLRLGVEYKRPHLALQVAGQYDQLYKVPGDAAGVPGGPLGTGAVYYLHSTQSGPNALKLKYANLALLDIFDTGLNVRGGRFTWANGMEANSGVPKIEKLKAVRVKDRVIGEFGWSFFQRAFDGAHVWWENDFGQASAAWFRPTEGGFENGGNKQINDIDVASISYTFKPDKLVPSNELQLFYYFYKDDRDVTQRVDNSGIGVVGRQDITIHSLGGHLAGAYDIGPGQLDTLLWGMGQFGDWFELDHEAGVIAAEVGYQFPKVWGKPWIRFEVLYSTGDSDPADGSHGTFYQMLPTVRQYASQASYNMMNSTDIGLDLILNPHPKVTVRTDVRYLRLSEKDDRWYAGAGATQKSGDIFGMIGRPSGGDEDFGWGGHIDAKYRPTKWLSLQAFYGWIAGGDVVQNNFTRDDTTHFVFFEVSLDFMLTGK